MTGKYLHSTVHPLYLKVGFRHYAKPGIGYQAN